MVHRGGPRQRYRIGAASSWRRCFSPCSRPGLLPGGHAAIEPLLQSAEQTRATMGAGAVVYAMPDAIFCRHVSFDNVTAEISEGGITRCADDLAGKRPRISHGFAWRAGN